MRSLFLCFALISLNSFSQNAPWLIGVGGPEMEQPFSIVVDTSKNVYTAGTFGGTMDFDSGPGTTNLSTTGIIDGYIMKLDPNGNLLWAKNFNADNIVFISSLSLDSLNNIYVAGSVTGNADLDPGIGTFTVNASGQSVFVVKLNSAGNFIWAKVIDDISIRNMFSDHSGNTYLTGSFTGTRDFDPSPTSFTLSASARNSYFLKLSASGNLVWVKKQGGNGSNDESEGYVVAQDKLGNNYLTGLFWGTIDFDPGVGVFNMTGPVNTNSQFILKTDALGNFIWAQKIAGSPNTVPLSINVPASGNIYTTGFFTGTTDFDPGATTFNLTSLNSTGNAFISKLDVSGNFKWAKQLKSTGPGFSYGIVCDTLENLYTCGSFQGVIDFDPSLSMVSYTTTGGEDMYILKLDSAGNYIWHKAGGGIDSDASTGITLDKKQSIYITGYFSNACDFGSISTNTLTSAGNGDIFVVKVGPSTAIGIEELSLQNKLITVYPNPSNGAFVIKSDIDLKLILTDNLGQIVQTIELIKMNNYQFNAELLSSGIYFLSGVGEHQSLKQKIVVTK